MWMWENKFAKLETINGLQILAELITSDDGHEIRVRRDDEVTYVITLGPWPNTEDGWAKAKTALEKANMCFLAGELDKIIAQMKTNLSTEPDDAN